MHEFGTTREQIAAIALNARRNAAAQPEGGDDQGELTLDDYLSSPMISDPLCLFDCDIAVDGATAVVISTVGARAGHCRTPAIHFEAVGSALHGRASWDQWEDMTTTGGDGRRRAPLVADRPQAVPTSMSPSCTTASRCSACSGSRGCGSAARARAARSSRAASASA